jgi:hypothetical protein
VSVNVRGFFCVFFAFFFFFFFFLFFFFGCEFDGRGGDCIFVAVREWTSEWERDYWLERRLRL